MIGVVWKPISTLWKVVRWLGDIIIPGAHGIGSKGFTPTTDGYRNAADSLVQLHNEGRSVDTSNYDVRRVLDYYGASSLEELCIKRRGW